MLWEWHLHFHFSVEEYHIPFGSETLAIIIWLFLSLLYTIVIYICDDGVSLQKVWLFFSNLRSKQNICLIKGQMNY